MKIIRNNMVYGLLFTEIDYILLDNTTRKYLTYLELGWDDASTREYLSNKENLWKIASFNTARVSFTASSRRNRFYAIYNRPDMIEKDLAVIGAVEAMKKLEDKFEIYALTAREKSLESVTLETMEKLGFNVSKMKIFFKEEFVPVENYITDTFKEIQKETPTGIAICLNPDEGISYQTNGYTPVGFTFLRDPQEFEGKIQIVCQNWDQILAVLESVK